MFDVDPALISEPTEFQPIDCVDDVPAREGRFALAPPAAPTRRRVSSQDLPRFSRTSLQ
jgi:hypothetical protein